MEDLNKKLNQIQFGACFKSITHFMAVSAELKKTRVKVHKFGEELNKPLIMVS